MSQTLEEWHAFIAAHLPEPVQREEREDGAYLTGGDPGEVVVRLSRGSVTVWEFAVTWDGPYTQVVTPVRVGSVRWRRVSERAGMKAVQALIEAAKEARRSKFRVCQRCSERHPPEWMHDVEVCVSCAQRHSGAVH